MCHHMQGLVGLCGGQVLGPHPQELPSKTPNPHAGLIDAKSCAVMPKCGCKATSKYDAKLQQKCRLQQRMQATLRVDACGAVTTCLMRMQATTTCLRYAGARICMQPYSCGNTCPPGTRPQLWGWVVVDDKTTATANRNRKAKPQEGFVWLP